MRHWRLPQSGMRGCGAAHRAPVREMDPAFVLGLPAPAARTRVFARFHRARAGGAADRGIALRHKRVPRQAVVDHVVGHVVLRPMRQRVDLDPPVVLGLEEPERGAPAALEPLAPRHPAVERGDGGGQRRHLAQRAAGVRVAAVQIVRRVGEEGLRPVGRDDTHIGQAQPLGHLALVVERFGKQHLGVDEDHRHAAVDHRHHVQEGHGLCTERRHHRHPAHLRVGERAFQHRGGGMRGVAGVEMRHPLGHGGKGGLKRHRRGPPAGRARP